MSGDTYYLLRCLDCNDPARAFDSPETRGQWHARHAASSGHTNWLVKDVVVADERPILEPVE